MGRGLVNHLRALIAAAAIAALPFASAQAEDGYDLWLRYAPLDGEALERLKGFDVRAQAGEAAGSPTIQVALAELKHGLASLKGSASPGQGSAGNIVL